MKSGRLEANPFGQNSTPTNAAPPETVTAGLGLPNTQPGLKNQGGNLKV